MNRDHAGFYHDPPLWIDSSPIDYTTPLEGEQQFREPDFEAFKEVIFERTLASDIRLKVARDGLFSFSFAAWRPGQFAADGTSGMTGFARQAETTLNRTAVMNSFLAFLYTQELKLASYAHERMIVTPELVIPLSSFDEDTGMGFGNQQVSHLVMSRYPSTYNSSLPLSMDSRISMRGQPVRKTSVQRAARDLSKIIHATDTKKLLIVDLFARASKSFQDHNYSAALISYWAITERLMQTLWERYQEANRTRAGEVFISTDRLKILQDGRSFTASVVAEVLSLTKQINLPLYRDITHVRKKRNSWIHSSAGGWSISAEDAIRATTVCERLLKKVEGLNLIGQKNLRLHG